MRATDISGWKFGKLTALEPTGARAPNGNIVWLCVCDCGTLKEVATDKLKGRRIVTCGCGRDGSSRLSDHPLYSTWENINQRCYNPNCPEYPNYGGRGLYNFWKNDSAGFLEWVDEHLGPRPEGCSLDRIDNDGGYVPGNLRWATLATQSANQRKPVRNAERQALLARIAELEAEVATLRRIKGSDPIP